MNPGEPTTIKRVHLSCRGIKKLELLKCENSQLSNWESVGSVNVDDEEDVQRVSFDYSNNEKHVLALSLKVRVLSGWDNFVCIYKISVIGLPMETLIDGSPAPKRK